MKCEKASEITAYLQGEGSEAEREMLRRHFEDCEACARELAQFERAFGAMGRIETIEPSPGFQSRVEAAFLRAHPELAPRPKFRLLAALSIAAGLLITIGAVVLALRQGNDPDNRVMGHVAPEVPRDPDIEKGVLPKTDLPSKIDAGAWGEALAYDHRLVGQMTYEGNAAAQKWLASKQDPDGSWKGANADETIELTGLSVLALGPTEQYGLAVRKGLAFLRSRQRDSGAIGGGSPESHAIAALAMQEAAIRTKDAAVIRAAGKAVALIAQQNETGPWGKSAVAGWHYHVLRLAVASGDRALTPILARGHGALGSKDAAEACAEFWTSATPGRRASEAMLDQSPIPGTEPVNFGKNDLWLAYFGSTLLRPQDGDAWTKWWSPLQSKLLKAQSADGSWPAGFQPGKGPIYVTALATIILEVPHRVPTLAD